MNMPQCLCTIHNFVKSVLSFHLCVHSGDPTSVLLDLSYLPNSLDLFIYIPVVSFYVYECLACMYICVPHA